MPQNNTRRPGMMMSRTVLFFAASRSARLGLTERIFLDYLNNSLHSSNSNTFIFTPFDSINTREESQPAQLAPTMTSGIPSMTMGPAHMIQGNALAYITVFA